MIEELIQKSIEDFNHKKDQVIRNRLIEMNINVNMWGDLLVRKQIRFSPFVIETHEGFGQLVYYNDGSANGLFVIGFTNNNHEFDMDHPYKFSISVQSFTEEPEWNKLPKTQL